MRHRSRGLVLVGLLAAAETVAAQPPGTVHQVGLLHVGVDHVPPSLGALRERLEALGYTEGENLQLDWRNVPNEAAAGEAARAFVRNGADVIVAFKNQSVRAAMAATADIPIVMLHVTDPVRDSFVESLPRPGRNVTGFAGLADVPAKRLEMLKEIHPALRRVLLLVDPRDPVTARQLAEVREAATRLALTAVERTATTEDEVKHVFGSVRPGEVDGVVVVSPNLYLRLSRLIRQALDKRLPVTWHRRFGAEAGALLSYGGDLAEVGRDAAGYVDKILKGARAAELPVQQLARFELVINRKTASALGLTVPSSLLLRANHLIQ